MNWWVVTTAFLVGFLTAFCLCASVYSDMEKAAEEKAKEKYHATNE